jgi:hypothetical protein
MLRILVTRWVSNNELCTKAGQWGEEIMITPENMVKASNAIVVNLTVRGNTFSADAARDELESASCGCIA